MRKKYSTYWPGMAALISLLVVVYTMTNSGGFHIIDEASRFAVTESLALRGDVDTNAIAWTQWVNTPREAQGEFGPDGDVYSKKGLGQPVLSVLWYLLLLIPMRLLSSNFELSMGLLQWTMLFPGLITATTAALVWRTAICLGYHERVGAILGLLFGLATIAWPYATYFLAEPLSTLSLLTCFYALLRSRDELDFRTYNPSGTRWLWLASIAGSVAIATTIVHILPLSVLGFYWLATVGQAFRLSEHQSGGMGQFKIRILLRWGMALSVPLALTATLFFTYNIVRFGHFWNMGYQISGGESFSTPLLQGLWGLLFSPYRSLFLHSPIFIISLFSFPLFYRRHRLEAITILGISIVLIALYSQWWMWWGGYAWGPRFLVPLAPFWILILAPCIERWLPSRTRTDARSMQTGHRWYSKTAIIVSALLLAFLSVAVQFSAVVVNFVNFETELRSIFPTDWLDPLKHGPPAISLTDIFYSPVVGQWLLLSRDPILNSDLAWLRSDGEVLWSVVLIGGIAIFVTTIFLTSWWRHSALKTTDIGQRQSWIVQRSAWLPCALAIIVILLWTDQVSNDPRYGIEGEGYRAVLSKISQESDSEDAIVTVAPYHYTVPMNWFQSTLPIYGYAQDSLNYAESEMLLTSVVQKHPRIWLVTAGLPPSDKNNSVERWLTEVGYKADDQWYNDFRLVRYATAGGLIPRAKTAWNVMLTDADNTITLIKTRAATETRPGQTFPVEVTFQMEAAGRHNLRWFIQLLSDTGQPVAMTDSASQGGYRTFVDLPVGVEIVEQLGLQIPQELPAGQYQLIIGLYNPERGGTRLVIADEEDYVVLGQVNIP